MSLQVGFIEMCMLCVSQTINFYRYNFNFDLTFMHATYHYVP